MSDNLKVAKESGATVEDVIYPEGTVQRVAFHTHSALEAYTSRILASQQTAHETEIAKLKEELREEREAYECTNKALNCVVADLSAANAACAMKDEALRFALLTAIYAIGTDEELPQRMIDFLASNVDLLPDDKTGEQVLDDAISCLSASPQQVSEWERKQLEPLRAEIERLEQSKTCHPAACRDEELWRKTLDKATEPLRAQVAYLSHELDAYRGQVNRYGSCTAGDALSNTQATADQFIAECEQRGAVKALEEFMKRSGFGSMTANTMLNELRATSKKAG